MLRVLLVKLIAFYRKYISRGTCMYRPTCSQYAIEAIWLHGALKGTALAAWRVLRCNPFAKGGYDPVPENFRKIKWVV